MANMPDEKNPFRKGSDRSERGDYERERETSGDNHNSARATETLTSLLRFLSAFLPKDQSGLFMIRLVSGLLIGVFLPFTLYFNVYNQEGRANPFSKEIPLFSWWINWQPHDALQNMPVVPAGKNGTLIYRPKNMSWISDQERVRQVYAPQIQNTQQKSAQAAIPQQQQGPDIRPQSGNEQRSAILGAYCLPDGLRCWVVGGEGMVQTTVNGGDSWIGQVSNTRNNLNSIYVSPDKTNGDALLVGERSTVLISRNLGRNWGQAEIVLGNHEYNAMCYCTESRDADKGTYLREHNARNHRLIRETLEQFDDFGGEWSAFLSWFQQIPLFIEKAHFRVVHACWDTQAIERFKGISSDNCLSEDLLHASALDESFEARLVDRLTRGTALDLPDGETILSKDGYVRSVFRTKFWGEGAQTYSDVVFQPDPLPPHLVSRKLSAIEKQKLLSYPDTELPVFVGHYWMSGEPSPISRNVACLDYSAVKYGKLVAYRMDDERVLDPKKFVWTDVVRK